MAGCEVRFCSVPVGLRLSYWPPRKPRCSAFRYSRSARRDHGANVHVSVLDAGPIKILGPFVQLTRGGDAAFAKRLAIRGFVYSCLALGFAALIGERSMRKYYISVPVLAIAAGIILFLVALQTVMHQFDSSDAPGKHEYEPSMRLAVSPLAFPTIVTPYGVAAVIIFMALTPDFATRSEIFAVLLGLMLLNLVAMLFAKPILQYAGMPLQLLGTVLAIIQVALGLQIIVFGLRGLGFGSAGR